MRTIVERDSVEAAIVAQWIQVLGHAPAHLDEDFFRAGGNSIQAAVLATRLSQAFNRVVPLNLIFECPTTREMGRFIRVADEFLPRRLLRFRSGGALTPLVLVPNVAGNVVEFSRFADGLFARPVFGLQSHGLSGGEPLTTVPDIVAELADVLASSDVPRRIHLGGYCVGGVVACALAETLAARGWDVASVMLLNTALGVQPKSIEEYLTERLRR